MKKLLALILVLVLSLTIFVGCTKKDNSSSTATGVDNSLKTVTDKGEIIIGLDDTFAPMGFHDTTGELVGFDIDLAVAVCEKLGIKATFQPIDWDAKDMELSTGKIDCIWNGMSATPERQESMSLSNPYLNNRIIIMTNTGVAVASKEDLANLNIGTQAKSAALETIMSDEAYDSFKDKVTEYRNYDEVIMDMQAGRIDCMVVDEVLGQYKNAKLGGIFGVSDVNFGDDLYAIGFRKGETALTDAVNNAITELIADGTAAEISKKWFGEDIVMK